MGITLTDGKANTPYVYKPYPKFVEHADGRACVVQDEAAWIALGPGWGCPSITPEPDIPAIADAEPALAEKPRRKARA